MVLSVGPAGTGKTYVGVALAVKALKEKQVRRIISPVQPSKQAKTSASSLATSRKNSTPICNRCTMPCTI